MANGIGPTRGGKGPSPPNNLPPIGQFEDQNYWDNLSDPELAKAQWIMQNTNITDEVVAWQTQDTLHRFTGSSFGQIRKGQRNPDLVNEESVQQGELLENYIMNAPQWDNSAPLYRGMSLTTKTVDNMKPGDTFDVNYGSASWSTQKGTAENFAGDHNGERVVFVCKKQTNATPIRHMSQWWEESEVLSSKQNRYRILNKKKVASWGNKTFTYVEVEQI